MTDDKLLKEFANDIGWSISSRTDESEPLSFTKGQFKIFATIRNGKIKWCRAMREHEHSQRMVDHKYYDKLKEAFNVAVVTWEELADFIIEMPPEQQARPVMIAGPLSEPDHVAVDLINNMDAVKFHDQVDGYEGYCIEQKRISELK